MNIQPNHGMTRRDLLRASGVTILSLSGAVATTSRVSASETRASGGTADGWKYVRGAGEIVPTDRTYAGEPALRVDYHFTTGYPNHDEQLGDVLLMRLIPAGERDWTGLDGLTFAIDGEQAPYAIQLQLHSGRGYVASPLITLETTGWHEVHVPFHQFTNMLGGYNFDWSDVRHERLVIRYQGGPFEPHTAYLGGWQRTHRTAPPLPNPETVETNTQTASLGRDTDLEVVIGVDDNVLYGIAGITVGGTLVRTRALSSLLRPIIYDVNGGEHDIFHVQEIRQTSGAATIDAVSADSQISLSWQFLLAPRIIDEQRFEGLRYRYNLSSAGAPADRVEEQATWELGGSSVGNTAVLRSSSWATEVNGALGSEFNTFHGYPPRFAHAAAFEYQAGEHGQLFFTFDRAACVTARFGKWADDDVFQYWDTYYLEQTQQVSTPSKIVLHASDAVESVVDLINAHTVVQDHVFATFRDMYGIQPPDIRPTATLPDGTKHLDDYLSEGWLDEVADMGFKVAFLGPMWNSDTENQGPSRATGIAVWTFDIANRIGGNDALNRFIEQAHDRGLTVGTWAPAAHLSKNAPVVEDNPDWVATGPFGAHANTYWSLATMDMRNSDARGHLLSGLTERRTTDGLDDVWLDSTHNHGFRQYNHASAAVGPHVEAMLDHMKDLQNAGFNVRIEGRGPFGQASSLYRDDRIQYYQGHEYRAHETTMYFGFRCEGGAGECEPDEPPVYDPETIDFYRFAANKALPVNLWGQTGSAFWDELRGNAELRANIEHANCDYTAVASHLGKRRLLPEDHGVEWASRTDETVTVLFSYTSFDYELSSANTDVVDVTTGEGVPTTGQVLHTLERHTYQITSQ